jgi:hypothetical protein
MISKIDYEVFKQWEDSLPSDIGSNSIILAAKTNWVPYGELYNKDRIEKTSDLYCKYEKEIKSLFDIIPRDELCWFSEITPDGSGIWIDGEDGQMYCLCKHLIFRLKDDWRRPKKTSICGWEYIESLPDEAVLFYDGYRICLYTSNGKRRISITTKNNCWEYIKTIPPNFKSLYNIDKDNSILLFPLSKE